MKRNDSIVFPSTASFVTMAYRKNHFRVLIRQRLTVFRSKFFIGTKRFDVSNTRGNTPLLERLNVFRFSTFYRRLILNNVPRSSPPPRYQSFTMYSINTLFFLVKKVIYSVIIQFAVVRFSRINEFVVDTTKMIYGYIE